jgi:hypothetical protein
MGMRATASSQTQIVVLSNREPYQHDLGADGGLRV